MIEIGTQPPTFSTRCQHGCLRFRDAHLRCLTLTVNLQLGSASDNWLEQCSAAFAGLRQPWSISASREGEALFNTIISGPTTEPAIIMALDTQPTRSWVIGLSLKKPPKAGTFIVKTALTKAEVQAYVP